MAAVAHWAGCELADTVLIVSVNKLFILFVQNTLTSVLYTESKKQKAKLTPTPPPMISTIIIIYSLCYQLIYWL